MKKIFPTYKSDVKEPWAKGYANCDVMLHPDLNEYTSISIGSGLEMYDIGYQCAMNHMQKIKEDVEALKLGNKR